MNKKKGFQANRVLSYFKAEWVTLAAVTVSGLIYNIGLLAAPWFEGRMAGRLVDILGGSGALPSMLRLAVCYAAVTALVQGARYIKRFYVRRFANDVNRRMKRILYGSLIRKSRAELEGEGVGSAMTKAIQDVDDCVEGMRKFTTEVFDTGVALCAYAVMLLSYDWRLALLSMLFPPLSFLIAEKMKTIVQRTGAAFKEASAHLNAATLDRAENAVTYRVFGCENERQSAYEKELSGYESAAVKANIWSAVLPPLYRIISMAGALLIIFFGARNIRGTGWTSWDIAVFTTFLSCFTRLAAKSSSAAKLFNAVHKAQVSWRRIQPLMQQAEADEPVPAPSAAALTATHAGFAYPGGSNIFADLSLSAQPGQIIGVTGRVACGKSTLGRMFLCEYPYQGSLKSGDRELSSLRPAELVGMAGYLGHDPELFNDSIENNILLGDDQDANAYLRAGCLDQEVAAMEDGLQTRVGSGGVRLSGGQAQRLALARTLCHRKPVMILDDPFSALDKQTEAQVFAHLKELARDSIVLLISHRLYLFPQMDQEIFVDHGQALVSTHAQLLQSNAEYARLFHEQEGGASNEK
mgnify:FL=1